MDVVRLGGVLQADYDYNAVNNLTRTTFGNGTFETRQYDELNRLKKLENWRGETQLASYEFTLDKVGNRKGVQEFQNGASRTLTYTYDDLYRLTKEEIDATGTQNDLVQEYGYDNVGNRLWKKETTNGTTTQTTYAYDGNDLLLNEKVNGVLAVEYTYDDNGSTQSKTEASGITTYVWDDEKRLVSATVNGQQMQYRYNDQGIRVSSTTAGVETRYLLDEGMVAQVWEEYSPNGQTQVSYVHGNDLISQTQSGQTTFYLVDGLGSTRLLTDTQGVVLNDYRYDAFGKTIGETDTTDNKYLFAGEQFDEGLGDYYLRQRFYDTSTGRFTRRDTYEGSLSNPLTLHKYGYTHNNPINSTDPTGLFTIAEAGAANAIRNILTQGYIDGGSRFVASVHSSNSFDDDLLADLAVTLAVPVVGVFVYAFAKAVKASIKQGGWLLKHEKEFGGIGHTIAKHVDVDDAYLLNRLSETRKNGTPRYQEVSAFTDKASAEKGIKEAVLHNKDEIRRWRTDPSSAPKIAFDYSGDGTTIGRGIRQGETAANPRYGTRVVLVKKNPSSPKTGFSILTSHPI